MHQVVDESDDGEMGKGHLMVGWGWASVCGGGARNTRWWEGSSLVLQGRKGTVV